MIFTDNPILFWHDMAMHLLKQNKSKNMHLFDKENVYITHTIGQNVKGNLLLFVVFTIHLLNCFLQKVNE